MHLACTGAMGAGPRRAGGPAPADTLEAASSASPGEMELSMPSPEACGELEPPRAGW